MARALIVGVSGQDGAYLARLLDAFGIAVWGTTRSAAPPATLAALGIADAVTLRPTPDSDDTVAALLDAAQPDAIYHLAGVAASDPVHRAHHAGSVTAIDPWVAALCRARATRLVVAVSAAVFGDTGAAPATEATPFNPRTPFAVASAAIAHAVAAARAEGLFAATGLMFPHESRFAPPHALVQHIIAAAHAQAAGRGAPLDLGSLDVARDCGWAPEFVDALIRMQAREAPEDWIVATGTLVTVRDIADWAYGYFKLDWRDYVVVDPALDDAAAPRVVRGDPARAAAQLGWRAHTHGRDLVETLCEGYAAARAG